MDQKHLIFFWQGQPYAVHPVKILERLLLHGVDELAHMPACQGIKPAEKGHSIFLNDGWTEYFPGSEIEKMVLVPCKNSVNEGGAAPEAANDKNRTGQLYLAVAWKEEIVQEKAKLVEELA